nr:sensor histidine kinase [Micromonospora sp. NBRC 107566]
MDEQAPRWLVRVTRAIPYVLLAVSAALAVGQQGWYPAGPLTLLAAAWMVPTLLPATTPRPRLMVAYCVGLLALIVALAAVSPWFGFFVFVGYMHSWAFLPGRWKLAGVAVTALAATAWLPGSLAQPSSVAVPLWLAVAAVVTALVVLFCRIGDVSVERNRRLAEALRENTALHAQLLVQAREAGVRAERQRLAGEIHDTIAQSLTGVITQLQAATAAAARPADRERHLANAARLAAEGLAEARRSVRAMRPGELASERLPDAVAGVAARWSATHGVPVEVTVTGPVRQVPSDAEAALLRAAQESLTNVARHAGATRVGLTLSYLDDLVSLDVRDDGVGFEVAAPVEGYGLAAMRDRVARLAGTMAVESEPGGGTAVYAAIPVPAESVEAAP